MKKNVESKGEKSVAEAVNLLEIFVGVMASLLDGNRNPDKTFLRAMTKTTKKSIKNLKKLIP